MLATAITFRSFRGRTEELAHLLQRRREAGGGRGGLVLVSGNAGSGKSRLLAEFRARLDAGRMHVAVAQCREASNRPYSAIVDGLARLGGTPIVNPGATRAELFSQIQRQMRALAERRTVILLIEDIHWATSDTLELLEAIVCDAASLRLLIVATHRSGEPPEDSPAFQALIRLHRLANTTHLILEPLPESVVGELLEEADSGVALDVRRRIVRLSEGNPFFAEELLRSSQMHGPGVTADGIPFMIRGLLQERFGRLDETEKEVLVQASVIGRRFSLDILQQILGLRTDEILRSLRSARDLHLIFEERSGTFAFVHALTREAIRATLLDAQARELHRRVGLALEDRPPRDGGVYDLAYHWWAAGDPQRAYAYGVRAGRAAMSVFAYEEAAQAYSYARAYADRDSRDLGPMLMDLGLAYGRLGLKKLAHSVLCDARDAFRAAEDIAGECEAATEIAAVRYILEIPEPGAPIEAMLPRLAASGNSVLQRRAAVALAQLHIMAGRFEDGAGALHRIEIDRAADDPHTLSTYYAMHGTLAHRCGDIARYVEFMRLGAACGIEGGLVNEPAMILVNLASGLTQSGYLDDAAGAHREAEAMIRGKNLTSTFKFLELAAIMRAVLTGDFNEARSFVNRITRVEVEMADLRALVAGWALYVALVLNDTEMRDRYFSVDLAMARPLGHLAAATAQRLRELGEYAQADAVIRKSLERDEGAKSLFFLFLAAAHSGDEELRTTTRARLAALAGEPQDRVFGPALELFDAIAASRAGDTQKCAERAVLAAEHFNALGFPLWEAEALALMGDVSRAAPIYRRIGAASRLRGALLEQRSKAPVASGRTCREALSPREVEVAELVAAGSTNAAVAAKLSITVKAVEKHLSSIYGKMAISSRAQLASHFRSGGR